METPCDWIERWLLMWFVKVESGQGVWPPVVLDPEPYLQVLPQLLPHLPAGAQAFVTDSWHYDFASSRCVKDLKLGSPLKCVNWDMRRSASLEFDANQFKRDARLVIRYQNVVRFDIAVDSLPRNKAHLVGEQLVEV